MVIEVLEIHPDSVELGALAIFSKFTGQNRLYMLGFAGEEETGPACHVYFHDIRAFRSCVGVDVVEQFEDPVVDLRMCHGPEPCHRLQAGCQSIER